MPGGTYIRNDIGLRRVQAGTQTVPETAVATDYRWYGDLSIEKSAPLVRTPEYTGTYDGLITPYRELPDFSGTYSEKLSYQSFAMHNQYAIKAGATGVASGTGYRYAVSPSATDDDIASATLEYGVSGQVFRSSGVQHDEYTIAIDTEDSDDAWKLNSNLFVRDKTQVIGFSGTSTGGTASTLTQTGAGWTVNQWAGYWCFLNFGTGAGQVRQITSNTADTLTFYAPVLSPAPGAGVVFRIEGEFTAGVPYTSYTPIRSEGTKLFLDPASGTAGTTQILQRFISANVTVANMRERKRFLEDVQSYSSRTGRGKRMITGQVRLEFDRRDEYQQWESLSEVGIKISQQGPLISGSTYHAASITLPRVAWDTVGMDTRGQNVTATFAFVAYIPASGNILTMESITNLSTLP